MALCTRCLGRIARTPIHRTQWHRIPHRYYSTEDESVQNPLTAHDDPAWFEKLRQEMLKRELPRVIDDVDAGREKQLYATLRDFFPNNYVPVFTARNPREDKPLRSLGNHLIYFNPRSPTRELLSDGTDTLHSPGGPFVRRMWAGGNLRVNAAAYVDTNYGWQLNKEYVCIERIKEVRLHGQGDTAKIFVTVERRFARSQGLVDSMRGAGIPQGHRKRGKTELFRKQVDKDGWGDAFLVEERVLVFMRERNMAELADIRTGKMAPTRYLDTPGTPDFSHALTPTSTLLFRFSALTFNAHAIHLDRDFCRNVEGHRNLLIHGPLTLMLMIKLVSAHLEQQTGAPQIVQSIDYRNLAPLYCDEELRICAREKTDLRTENGSIYDVWIEGPTGGMAVKGTLRTVCVPKRIASRQDGFNADKKSLGTENSKDIPGSNGSATSSVVRPYKTDKGVGPGRHSAIRKVLVEETSSQSEVFKPTPFSLSTADGPQTSPTMSDASPPEESTSTPFIPSPTPSTSHPIPLSAASTRPRSNTPTEEPVYKPRLSHSHASALLPRVPPLTPLAQLHRPHSTTTRTESVTTEQTNDSTRPNTTAKEPTTTKQSTDEDPKPLLRKIRRLMAPPKPMRPTMSPVSRRIAQTIQRQNPHYPKYDPIPLVRKYGASEWPTTFDRKGVRLIVPNAPRVRQVVPKPKGWQERRRLEWQGWEDGVWKRRRGGYMGY